MTTLGDRKREGTLAKQWHKVFGYRDHTARQIRRIEAHGAWKYALARFISFFLLIAFSIGALVTLAADSTQVVIAEYEQGGLRAVNWIQAGTCATIFIFVIAMDTALLIGAAKIRDGMQRGLDWLGDMTGLTALVVFLSLIEATTYIAMTVQYEHPHGLLQWALIFARGIAIPIVAIFLSLVDQTPVGRRDITRLIQQHTGKQILDFVQDVLSVANNPAATWGLFATVNGATEEEAQWDAVVQGHLAKLAPESRESRERELAEARAALEAAQGEAERLRAEAARQLQPPLEVASVAPKAASLDAQIGVTDDEESEPSPDDDGPGGGGGLPVRGRRATPRPLATVSALNSAASARNSSALAARKGIAPETWDWQQVRDYAAETYDVEMTRTEALALIRQCDTARRDARRPGRPLVASRKQLEQRVRLALGIRGAGNPNPAHPTLRASA